MKSLFWIFLLSGVASGDITAPPFNPTPLRPSGVSSPPADFELPVVLTASNLLGTEVVGPAHRVRESVPTDGFMAHFTIDSDYGVIECVGTSQALSRIRELQAIKKLVELSKSDLFAEGVKRSVEQPIAAVKNIVKDPAGSIKAVPRTVGHFFQKVGQAVGSAASNIKERIDNGDDKNMGVGIGNATKSIIGFDAAKLECAKQLGVDPYTDNERLQQEIEKVSWVFFSGGLPLRIGTAVVSGGASVALTATKVVGLPQEIYALTPNELALKNQQAMDVMGVSNEVSSRFLASEALSITLRCSMIRSLQAMGSLRGSAAVIEVAANCENRRQAEFLDQAVALLARQQVAGRSTYTSLEFFGRLLCGVDSSGGIQISAPVDYISWTSEVAGFALREDLVGRKPSLLLAGGATARTRTELQGLRWTVTTP